MQDTAVAVPPLPRQVVMLFALSVELGVEQYPLIDQPLHAVARIAGDKLNGVFVTQAGSGNQSVIYV
ncbi:hypothetical protein D3C78_1538100 [compost metagenome]